jgi:hypothetical protein
MDGRRKLSSRFCCAVSHERFEQSAVLVRGHSEAGPKVAVAARVGQPAVRSPSPVANDRVNKAGDADVIDIEEIADETRAADHRAGSDRRAGVREGELEDLLKCSRSLPLLSRAVKFKLLIKTIHSRPARESLRAALHFVIQDYGLGDLLHRLAQLLALPLQRAIGLFLADLHFALQDSFRALDQLARLELSR